MLTEKTFDTGTVTINYAEGLPAGLPLVMLHGISGWWQTFLPIIPNLSVRYQLYALDFRGHGRSSRAPGAYQWEEYARDTIQLLHQQIEQPVVLLGHSLGAMVAIQIAAETPKLIRALVLEDPPLYGYRGERIRARPLYPVFKAWRDLAQSEYSLENWTARLTEVQPDADAVELRARAKSLSLLDPDVLTQYLDGSAIDAYEIDEFLRRVVCPVLLLRGDPALGGAIERADLEHTQSLLSQLTVVDVPGVGHSLHTLQPTLFSRLVTDFLEAL